MDESAYAYLLGVYLGDGHLTRGRRDVYALNVKCSDDWPGLIDAAKSAMAAVMPASGVFCVRPARLHGSEKHIQALAVFVPPAWSGEKARSHHRANRLAG